MTVLKQTSLFLLQMILMLALLSYAEVTPAAENKTCPSYQYTTCPCGSTGQHIVLPIKICDDYPGNDENYCEPCNKDYLNFDLCKNFEKCSLCIFGYKRCAACPEGWHGKFCEIEASQVTEFKMASDEEYYQFQPITVEILPGEPFHKNRILRQAAGACAITAESIKTATSKCTIYDSYIKCRVQCVWGYTFPQGETRDITCEFKDNIWKPYYFEECKPYINCKLETIRPGEISCTTLRTDKPPDCTIMCNGQNDNKSQKYVCNSEGYFEPPLPPCVRIDDTLKLVAKP